MADEFDFSELRNYLQGQVDLGAGLDEFYLDEPWALEKKQAAPARPFIPPTPASRPAPIPQRPAPLQQNSAPTPPPQPASFNGNQGSMFGSAAVANAPAPRVAKRSASVFESANSLDEFYTQIKDEALYSKEPNLVRYMGPEHPKLLFLLPGTKPGMAPAAFFQSPVGEMLVRLFANLNIGQESMGVTYFFKSTERALSPLLETALKKMLMKELSFIQPEMMVCFGQPLFHQLFGKAKNFDELAGSDQDFSGTRTCPLVDPYQMVNDKQLKWLTWKVHIPRNAYFTAK
ncbi:MULTISPECIES: hypothetical protein [unclassified Fibrobacter]|uniref:hypothetical protein n=1 Tax=unclassified Fibrobacter TaxID=2634177 RepID=UPI000D6B7CE7|nr:MULTISPECIES: hypothetical protein [unclassified Fibrobacter]PWJ64409.1 uracil-DNA glycosylase [Fibrobacter sp. UWR4]PZW69286.1 uracil-DNA glycosylase [Fibrobacter sp. UWR1]